MSDIFYSAYRASPKSCSTTTKLQNPTPEAVAYIDEPTKGVMSSAITVGVFIACVLAVLPHI